MAEITGKAACPWGIISPGVIITMPVLTAFTEAAMREAKYKILEDGTFYGAIPSCPGVWANEETLERCREVLQEVLEEWLILKLRDRDPLPNIGEICFMY